MNITPDPEVATLCTRRLRRNDGVERIMTSVSFSPDAMVRLRWSAVSRGLPLAGVLEELILAHLPQAPNAS